MEGLISGKCVRCLGEIGWRNGTFGSLRMPPFINSQNILYEINKIHHSQSHIVDFSWSKSGFLLSASLDCTVRLWHVSNDECLCVFKHKLD